VVLEVQLPDEAVLTALITGCTAVAVTTIRAAARVTIAWLHVRHGLPPPPAEVEPPDP